MPDRAGWVERRETHHGARKWWVSLRATHPTALVAASITALFLLAGCHGGALDAVYPGTLGHDPPPAVNLPPQDAGMEHL
jgi:hypothetical protein